LSFQVFFAHQLELNYAENQELILKMLGREELIERPEMREFSHVLNLHYIWNCRLKQVEAESDLWDVLPMTSWEGFNRQNLLESRNIIREINMDSEKEMEMTFSALQHIIKHSVYHRSRVILFLKERGIENFSTNFVRLES
jgi:uncharacterized damage-inducible protein DinB